MTLNYERSFLKDIKKLNDKNIAQKLKHLINEFEHSETISNIINIKKLKGYNSYYRLKIGDYRLGFFYKDDRVDLVRFLHRKDIYRWFP